MSAKGIRKSFAICALAALPLLGCGATSTAGHLEGRPNIQPIKTGLGDGGFEAQSSQTASPPWVGEGIAGIDLNPSSAKTGNRSAFVGAASGELKFNAIRQSIGLCQGDFARLSAMIRTSSNFRQGWLGFRGFRDDAGFHPQRVVSDVAFGPLPNGYVKVNVAFRAPEENGYNVFVGFWGSDPTVKMRVDDVKLTAVETGDQFCD
jgi:hypothetical protein